MIYRLLFLVLVPLALISQTVAQQTSTTLPGWAEDQSENVDNYYALHTETTLDRFLSSVACTLGVIIHGDVDQVQLESQLCSFDISKLMLEGPSSEASLSLEAQQLIYESLSNTPRVFDIHLHNMGYDEGNYLNPCASVCGIAELKDYFTFMVLRYASGMSTPLGSTQEARKRIQLYAAHFPKLCGIVLPIHAAFSPDGSPDWGNTGSYLANEAALQTALTYTEHHSTLFSAISVHPFDPNWREQLLQAHAKGIRLVKWMPPQSIPPDSDLLDAYYQQMKALHMTLIAHAGPEHAIPTTETNKQWADWGNPLRFRKPLEIGVDVILAHCGHHDEVPDLDHPNQQKIQGCQLFFRLAREAHQKNQSGEWTGKLFGDLAAVTTHYGPAFIKELLCHSQEEGIRLLYGSDYPYTNLISPGNEAYGQCAAFGLLDKDKVRPLQELRTWNPLLANYIFTKHLEYTNEEGSYFKFPESTFTGLFEDAALVLIDEPMWEQFKKMEADHD